MKYLFKKLFEVNPGYIYLGIFCILSLDAIEMLPAILLKNLFSNPHTDASTQLVLVFCCYLSISILRWGWRYFLIFPSRRAEANIKEGIFKKIHLGELESLKKLKRGDVVSFYAQDAMQIRQFLGPGILVFFDSMAYLIFIPSTLLYLIGIKALYLLLFFIPLIFIVAKKSKKLEAEFEQISTEIGHLSDHVLDETMYRKFFRFEQLENIRKKKYAYFLNNLFSSQKNSTKIELLFEIFSSFALYGCITLILYATVYPENTLALSVATLLAVLQLLDKLIWPVMSFNFLINLYQNAKASVSRISSIESIENKKSGLVKLDSQIESICIKNLCYKKDGLDIISSLNLNLDFKIHKTIAIVGENSSGKSTLLKILSGLIDHKQFSYDEFTINGIDIKNLDLSSYFNQMNYIPQNIELFSMSIKQNIALTNIPNKNIDEAILRAELQSDFEYMPQGKDTLIGEKGINLSGGQRARILIARSFAENATLNFWDDPLAPLDEQTKKNILQNIRNKNMNLILVTHATNLVENFDKIIYMKSGTICEDAIAPNIIPITSDNIYHE
jgi:ATP-binding cassette subfamily B multidrug efflux pump